MKRDMELIRNILLSMESAPPEVPFKLDSLVNGTTSTAILHRHLQLLAEAEFIQAIESQTIGPKAPQVRPIRITWKGYDFLDASRDEGTWRKSMQLVKDKVGSVSVDVLTEILKKIALGAIGN